MPITYLAAFFGGVIALFTPCSAMVIPMFAAAMANRKQTPIYTLGIFSLGLLLSLLPLAVGAVLINKVFSDYREPISLLVGLGLLVSGMFVIFGRHIHAPDIGSRIQGSKHISKFGTTFTLGVVAGLGSTACIGPILGAILSLSAAASSTLTSITLMLSYALGLLIPIVFITLLYESFFESRMSKLRNANVTLANREFLMIDLLGGGLLVFLGILFLFHQGSIATIPFISHSGILDTSFDLQDKLFLLQ